MAVRAEDLPRKRGRKIGDPAPEWFEKGSWWPDEAKTKQDVTDLVLRQMYAYLASPQTQKDFRLKLFSIAAKWVDKIEVSPAEKAELLTLLKTGARLNEPTQGEPPPSA